MMSKEQELDRLMELVLEPTTCQLSGGCGGSGSGSGTAVTGIRG